MNESYFFEILSLENFFKIQVVMIRYLYYSSICIFKILLLFPQTLHPQFEHLASNPLVLK